MDVFTIAVWVGTVGFLLFSLVKDKEKTKKVFKKAIGMGKSLILSIIAIGFFNRIGACNFTAAGNSGLCAKAGCADGDGCFRRFWNGYAHSGFYRFSFGGDAGGCRG